MSGPGFATIVKNPLYEVLPTERLLVVERSDKDRGAEKQGGPTRLLSVFQAKQSERGIDSIYPRAELVIIMPPKSD